MSSANRVRKPKDEQRSISIVAQPWAFHTVVEISVHRRGPSGRTGGRIALWHIKLTREELAGRDTDDVIRAVCERLLCRLEPGCTADPADFTAVGPGAPLGATGGTVTQPRLPGL